MIVHTLKSMSAFADTAPGLLQRVKGALGRALLAYGKLLERQGRLMEPLL